jgi:hypothetical protein
MLKQAPAFVPGFFYGVLFYDAFGLDELMKLTVLFPHGAYSC